MTTDLDNPFPGMNPWLWDHWHSLHAALLTYLRDDVSEQLPPGLAALTEERVVIDSPRFGPGKTVVPDVAVEERWDGGGAARSSDGWAVVEPHVAILDDPVERWIEIVDGSGALITVIEVISHSNKADEAHRAAYRSKQHAYQEGGINLVEIDLLHGGRRYGYLIDYGGGPSAELPRDDQRWAGALLREKSFREDI